MIKYFNLTNEASNNLKKLHKLSKKMSASANRLGQITDKMIANVKSYDNYAS